MGEGRAFLERTSGGDQEEATSRAAGGGGHLSRCMGGDMVDTGEQSGREG